MVNGLDIGALLFQQILHMNEYPGAPFSGDLLRDLITFFFVPTVFLIAVIFFGVGIVLPPAWRGMRLLFGLAAYLFVVVSGYYPIFAYIAGPYFFVLIVLLGLVYFLFRHFARPGLREGGGGAGGAPPRPMAAEAVERGVIGSRKRLAVVNAQIKDVEARLHALRSDPESREQRRTLEEYRIRLVNEKHMLEEELGILKHAA